MRAQDQERWEQDRREILRVHDQWWESNRDFDIEKMRGAFAREQYLQYNLTGHPYYGLEEKTRLWEALQGAMTIPEISPPQNLRLEIVGDMAWLACENIIRVEVPEGVELGAIPSTPFRVRSTEVYQRDDGQANPEWRIWHFHCSPAAAEDEPRVPMGDSYATRAAADGA